MRLKSWLSAACGAGLLVGAGAAVVGQRGAVPAAFVTAVPWVGQGEWLRADLHAHSRFSDGARTFEQVASLAAEDGCDVLAVADHADRKLRGASAEYGAALAAARAAHPSVVFIAALEWNVPPWGGDEHATVLVPDAPETGTVLADFKRQWDDYDLNGAPKPAAGPALAWLAGTFKGAAARPVVIYNHPSRPDASSLENIADIKAWRAVNDLVIGFESGPGHQRATPLSSYRYKERPIDRWDPVAARPGDAWDQVLRDGLSVHGAVASSDFHNENPKDLHDFRPCQFSETWIYAPERTVAGVLRALRAGTFFGAHGRIAREAALTVEAPGLPRAAVSGEHLRAPAGSTITAALHAVVPDTDWEGQPNRLHAVEFILTSAAGTEVVTREVTGGDVDVRTSMRVPPGGLVIRARGRRNVEDGPDLLFYTNAIRVSTRP